jgi:hypothetical protein
VIYFGGKPFCTLCHICASTVALIGAIVSQALFGRAWLGKPALSAHQPLDIEQPCSCLVLRVATRLLGIQFRGDTREPMACVVSIIHVNANFVIDQYCRISFMSVEGTRIAVPVGTHSLNKPSWQVFSCFSRLTSYSRTATI